MSPFRTKFSTLIPKPVWILFGHLFVLPFRKFLHEAKKVASERFIEHGKLGFNYSKSVKIVYNVLGAAEAKLKERFVVSN